VRPGAAKRQRSPLWYFDLISDETVLPLWATEHYSAERRPQVEQSYAKRLERVEAAAAEAEEAAALLPPIERRVALALLHSASEGVLHPKREDKEASLTHVMPDWMREKKVALARPYPMPPSQTPAPSSVAAAAARMAAAQERSDSDGDEGSGEEEPVAPGASAGAHGQEGEDSPSASPPLKRTRRTRRRVATAGAAAAQ